MTIDTSGRPRQIAPGIHHLGICHVYLNDVRFPMVGGKPIHLHLSNYMILGTEKTLLIDTGEPAGWEALSAQIDQVLNGRELNYLFPTHPEFLHSANLTRILDKYPECRVVGDVRDYEMYFPGCTDRMDAMPIRSEIDLGGGYEFVILEAPIKDLPASVWGYEKSQQALFCADAFSFAHINASVPGQDMTEYHLADECSLTTDELPGGVGQIRDNSAFILRAALYWLRYIDPNPLFAKVEKLFQEFPPKIVAPAHGHVIINPREVVPIIEAEMESVSGTSGTMADRVKVSA
ncbi:oxygen-binding di-iron domain-containing protein [Acuticoccus mangrovi]|uniref:ODP domain-containing protein n=1 Tax=Acuticoccus mangrovi TaxID=2796142 RepID=A0A934IL74_9HYPH|nr:hypothetical protein [Acuticoccus mangrovi]MBJ3777016.1 hypothetical protein [Acuticoccus mangrovi]